MTQQIHLDGDGMPTKSLGLSTFYKFELLISL